MKVCYLNHDTRSNTGAGSFYNSISKALKKVMPDLEFDALTSENILYPNKLKLLLALPVIRKIIKKCDIVHALDGWPYGVIAALASLGLKKKLIITAIGTGGVKPLYNWWQRPFLEWAYRKADRVVAVSHNTKKEIQKFLPDLKIEVVNHGVDATKYEGVRENRLANLKPYILSVGAWKPRKGFEYSIKAFEIAKNKVPNLKYVIVSNVTDQVKAKYQQVTFLENLLEEDLVALYKNAELFILLPQDANKDIEGFGLVFLEAAAAGLPVIGSKNSSAEDAVADGRNGILVPPQDINAASEAIGEILNNKNLRDSFSWESVNFAKTMSWEKAAKSYRSIYKSIL